MCVKHNVEVKFQALLVLGFAISEREKSSRCISDHRQVDHITLNFVD